MQKYLEQLLRTSSWLAICDTMTSCCGSMSRRLYSFNFAAPSSMSHELKWRNSLPFTHLMGCVFFLWTAVNTYLHVARRLSKKIKDSVCHCIQSSDSEITCPDARDGCKVALGSQHFKERCPLGKWIFSKRKGKTMEKWFMGIQKFFWASTFWD